MMSSSCGRCGKVHSVNPKSGVSETTVVCSCGALVRINLQHLSTAGPKHYDLLAKPPPETRQSTIPSSMRPTRPQGTDFADKLKKLVDKAKRRRLTFMHFS